MKSVRNLLVVVAFLLTAALFSFGTTRYVAQTAGTFSGGTACNGQTAITPATWNSTTESCRGHHLHLRHHHRGGQRHMA